MSCILSIKVVKNVLKILFLFAFHNLSLSSLISLEAGSIINTGTTCTEMQE